MSTAQQAVASPTAGFWDRHNELHSGLLRAILADPSILNEIPNGANLILVPHDADDAYLQASVEVALTALQRGQNVHLRRLEPGEWYVSAPDDEPTGPLLPLPEPR